MTLSKCHPVGVTVQKARSWQMPMEFFERYLNKGYSLLCRHSHPSKPHLSIWMVAGFVEIAERKEFLDCCDSTRAELYFNTVLIPRPCREVLDKTIIRRNGDKCSQLLESPAL